VSPQTPKPYTIALIGCGRVGVLLEDDPLRVKPCSHMGGIQKIIRKGLVKRGLEPVAICDIDEQRLNRCGERWNISISSRFTDYKELIRTHQPDIVNIAAWTSTHRDIAVYAAQNGVKGIVLEKPVSVNLELAREIVHTCEKQGVKLVINHERRWDPLFRKTKEIIQQKTLGELKLVYGNVLGRFAPRGTREEVLAEYGGGPLLHDGTHLVDMIRYFAGEIDTVCGFLKNEDPSIGAETTAVGLLRSQNGVNIFIEAGGMREYFNFEMDLQFTGGRIKVGNGIAEYYEAGASSRYTGYKDLVRKPFPPLNPDLDPFTGAIMDIVEGLEQGKESISSGRDGLKAMEIIFDLYHFSSTTHLFEKAITDGSV